MPLPVIANTFRCGIVQEVGGVAETMVNVIHVFTGGGMTATQVGEAVRDQWVADIAPLQANNVVYNEVDVLELNGTSGTVVVPFVDPDTHGTHGSNEMIGLQTAAICTLRTGLAGRSHRGRLFLSGLQRSQIDQTNGHQLDGSARTAMQTAFEAFLSDLDTAGVSWVVASYTNADEHPVTSVTVRSYLGTQRRRVNNS